MVPKSPTNNEPRFTRLTIWSNRGRRSVEQDDLRTVAPDVFQQYASNDAVDYDPRLEYPFVADVMAADDAADPLLASYQNSPSVSSSRWLLAARWCSSSFRSRQSARKNPSRISHSMRPQQLPVAEHGGGNNHRERSVCENRANASAG